MKRSLIFDLDGTLANTRGGIEASAKKAILRVFPQVDTRLLTFEIGPPIRQALARAIGGDPTPAILDQLEAAFREIYDAEGWQDCDLYPWVLETLEALRDRGHKLYIVTSKPDAPSYRILEKIGIQRLFAGIICRHWTAKEWHKADGIKILIDRHGLNGSNCVYIGDTDADAAAAAECGIPFVGALYGYGEIRTIASIAELAGMEW